MEVTTILAIAAPVIAIAVNVWTFFKSRTAIAVQAALTDKRVADLEKDLADHKGELNGIKAGLETGIGRVQDSLHGVSEQLNKLQTTVAILVDRDERRNARSPSSTRTRKPSV